MSQNDTPIIKRTTGMNWADMSSDDDDGNEVSASTTTTAAATSTIITSSTIESNNNTQQQQRFQPVQTRKFKQSLRREDNKRRQNQSEQQTTTTMTRHDLLPQRNGNTKNVCIFHKDYKNSDYTIKDCIHGGVNEIQRYGERTALHVYHAFCTTTLKLYNVRWGVANLITLNNEQLQKYKTTCSNK